MDSPPATFSAVSSPADTLEINEIELEDEGEGGVNYKAIAALIIASAFVGYTIYIFLVPEEDKEEVDSGGGKEPPIAFIRIPFGG